MRRVERTKRSPCQRRTAMQRRWFVLFVLAIATSFLCSCRSSRLTTLRSPSSFCHLERITTTNFGGGLPAETVTGFSCEGGCFGAGQCTKHEVPQPNGNVATFCDCVRGGAVVARLGCDLHATNQREGGLVTSCLPSDCPAIPDRTLLCTKRTTVTILGDPGGRQAKIEREFCECVETI